MKKLRKHQATLKEPWTFWTWIYSFKRRIFV